MAEIVEQQPTTDDLWAVFDTETTGLVNAASVDPKDQPYVIEFAGVVLNAAGDIVHEFESIYKPPIKIPEIITKITGLSDAKLVDALPFNLKEIETFFTFPGVSTCLAHNLTFDRAVLGFEFARAGQHLKLPRGICTVEATEHLKGRRLKLGQMYKQFFNEEFVGAHRAMMDVKALARCVVHMRKGDMIK